jgi:hypothetical protein
VLVELITVGDELLEALAVKPVPLELPQLPMLVQSSAD